MFEHSENMYLPPGYCGSGTAGSTSMPSLRVTRPSFGVCRKSGRKPLLLGFGRGTPWAEGGEVRLGDKLARGPEPGQVPELPVAIVALALVVAKALDCLACRLAQLRARHRHHRGQPERRPHMFWSGRGGSDAWRSRQHPRWPMHGRQTSRQALTDSASGQNPPRQRGNGEGPLGCTAGRP